MGTRSIRIFSKFMTKDHPHAYGDKSYNYAPYPHIQGSSPRVWGQEVLITQGAAVFWIIPTRMGTRVLNAFNLEVSWDHPHAYGDKCESGDNIAVFAGSSPRVWGQGKYNACVLNLSGIIPTRMGTS